MSSILDLTAHELAIALAKGSVSAEEAARAYLNAISERDSDLHTFNEVWHDEALDRARALDSTSSVRESALAGLPIALKDNLCTLQGHTTCSSRILAGYRAPYQATVVSRLENAGANIVGKTNMDEFAMGSSTENSCDGPTRNPWDTDRVPGGSSGGSAAAVAARLTPIALGSDTGGSIRQPAAFCGVVGLKPTYGRVSRFGLVAYGSSLDQIGPLTRDVTDCALLLGTIAGADPHDSTSVDQEVPNYLTNIERPVDGLRIGVVREFLSNALDGEIRSSLEKAQKHFAGAGAEIVEVSLPHSRIDTAAGGELSSFAVACYYIIAMVEASSNLSRYDGVHYGHRTAEPAEDIIELYSKSRSEGFGDEVQRRIMLGTFALSSGYYDAYYLKALKVRRLIKEDFDRAFSSCDLLLTPVSPTPPFRIGENTADPLTMYLQDIYTLSLNLAGLPGLALPCGLTDGGLPIGMQLVAPVFSEDLLLRAGRMFELASGVSHLTPPGVAGGGEEATG